VRELALFAGSGGGILGGHLLGWRTICAVECDPYAASVLVARQNDGCLPPFPIWDDVRTFDGKPWRGIVDVISGGFPCQDISTAGRGAGIDGERSGLWREMARIIGEVRPSYVLVENSPALISRGLTRVLGDLTSMGYDARWGVLGAHDVGAPHKRDRIWILASASSRWRSKDELRAGRDVSGLCGQELADASSVRSQRGENCNGLHGSPCSTQTGQFTRSGDGVDEMGDPNVERLEKRQGERRDNAKEQPSVVGSDWWYAEPELGRVAHGVAYRVDRLRSIGNGQVPSVVRLAWQALIGGD
jgi:DNA (cytosine-5)-methyltransferase 1